MCISPPCVCVLNKPNNYPATPPTNKHIPPPQARGQIASLRRFHLAAISSGRLRLSVRLRFRPAWEAAAFLDDMRRWHVPPSRPDYRAVLHALLREEMVAGAYQVVKEKMDSDVVPPEATNFELVMCALSESGEFDAVEEVFDEMLLRGLVPGVAVYNVYVASLCKKGDLADARRMLDCMERAGCPPDSRTFDVIVAGCMSAGEADAAREATWEAMRRGLRWDSSALAELVNLLRARFI